MLALNLSLEMALFVFLGIFLIKIKLFTPNFEYQLSRYLMNIALPCLIVNSIVKNKFDPAQIINLAVIILISILMTCLFFIIGTCVWLYMKKSSTGRVARYGITFANFSYIGIPVMETLYGAEGLFYYTIFLLPIRIVYYIYPSLFLGEDNSKKEKLSFAENLRRFFSAPLIALIVALIIYFASIPLPTFLTNAVSKLSATASPLGMILCGMTLAKLDLHNLFKNKNAFIYIISRCLICPAIVILILLFAKPDIIPLFGKIAIVYAGLPVSATTATFAINYEKEEAVTQNSLAIFVTTLLAIVTLPLFSMIADKMF